MHRFGDRQASDVYTLALSRPSFDSYIRPLKQGCMLLAEPSYLLYPAPMNAAVARGSVLVQMLLPQAPPVVINLLAHDQLVI
jgi:hypothetical protein